MVFLSANLFLLRMSASGFAASGRNGANSNSSPIPGVDPSDYYGILGVERDATPEEIKKAYRKMALKYHPDHGGDAEAFKMVSLAYSVLSDADQKDVYDRYGVEGLQNGGGENEYESFNPFDLFGSFFGNGFSSSMGFGDFSFFDEDSVDSEPKRQRRSTREEDIVQELDCDLSDLYAGKEKLVQVKHTIVCKACNGRGSRSGGPTQCKKCNGRGVQTRVMKRGFMTSQTQTTCSMCHGTGKFISAANRCSVCHGSGIATETKGLSVRVPAGSLDGDTIRMRGAGNAERGGRPGDVVFVIHELPHESFMRKGSMLITKMQISLGEALCGFTRTLETVDHRKLRISSPRGTVVKPNSWKIVEGEGMPKKNGGRGDLLIHFSVQFPESMGEENVQALQKLLGGEEKMEVTEDVCEEVTMKEVDERKKASLMKEAQAHDYHGESGMYDHMADETSENDCCVY